jgi:hypothetical protein
MLNSLFPKEIRTVNREQAELIGLQALSHIAADEELLLEFINISGFTPDELRQKAQDAEVLGGVLDFLLMNDERVLAFAEAIDIPPTLTLTARRALPGGQEVNWS